MFMKLSKIFDALNVVLFTADMRENLQPVRFTGIQVPVNFLVHLNKGNYFNDKDKTRMKEGSFYFRPAGSTVEMRIGQADQYLTYGAGEGFPSPGERSKFQNILDPQEDISGKNDVFSSVVFEVLLHNSFPLFKILQLPVIPLPEDAELAYLMRELCVESYHEKLGKQRILKNYTEEVVIRIFRYIHSFPEYQKNLEKLDFLGDKRLTAIIDFIRENVGEDLSNKKLASVSFLSEDYIGQFFKNLTNQNLQDFIENQRLEIALEKLNSTSDSISEIAFSVGFKDPAYFSRRFKLKYNVNANALRNSKSTFL
jgi:AraC-like DNA-binding protein